MKSNGQNIVCKFGGGWFSNPEALNKIKNIVFSDEKRKIIVVSAPGRRFCDDEKVTDLLLRAAFNCSVYEKKRIFEEVEKRYLNLAEGCSTKIDINRLKKIIRFELEKSYGETLVSRGEYLTAVMLSEYLGFEFVDAKKSIKISNGLIDEEKCVAAARTINVDKGIVVPGFYGEDENGKVKLLPRGGSDLTGAVLSVAFGADIYENYTDTDGVYSADPKKTAYCEPVKKISYGLLSDFSFCGAGILSTDTCDYLKRSRILTIIKSDDGGNETTVTENAVCKNNLFALLDTVKIAVEKYDGIGNARFCSDVFISAEKCGVKIAFSYLKKDKTILYLSSSDTKSVFDFSETLKTNGYLVCPGKNVCLCTLFCNKKNAMAFLEKISAKVSCFSFAEGVLTFEIEKECEKFIYEAFGKFERTKKTEKSSETQRAKRQRTINRKEKAVGKNRRQYY